MVHVYIKQFIKHRKPNAKTAHQNKATPTLCLSYSDHSKKKSLKDNFIIEITVKCHFSQGNAKKGFEEGTDKTTLIPPLCSSDLRYMISPLAWG